MDLMADSREARVRWRSWILRRFSNWDCMFGSRILRSMSFAADVWTRDSGVEVSSRIINLYMSGLMNSDKNLGLYSRMNLR